MFQVAVSPQVRAAAWNPRNGCLRLGPALWKRFENMLQPPGVSLTSDARVVAQTFFRIRKARGNIGIEEH